MGALYRVLNVPSNFMPKFKVQGEVQADIAAET